MEPVSSLLELAPLPTLCTRLWENHQPHISSLWNRPEIFISRRIWPQTNQWNTRYCIFGWNFFFNKNDVNKLSSFFIYILNYSFSDIWWMVMKILMAPESFWYFILKMISKNDNLKKPPIFYFNLLVG